MAEKKNKNSIEIERSAIEQSLMSVKDFVKGHAGTIRKVIIGAFVLMVLIVSVFVYVETSSASAFRKYEAIVDAYRMNPEDRGVKDKTIGDLRELAGSTKFGHAHQMSFYMLGNLLYEDGKYGEAFDMFTAFIKKSSSDGIFVPIAVSKASICLEEQGKVDEAILLLQKFEEENSDSIVLDQVIYNTGRLYALKGDKAKAKEYYNKVISAYPESVFSERARERLMILGASK